MLLLLACTHPSPDSDMSDDTPDDTGGDTGDTTPVLPMPWEVEESFWTAPGPLADLLTGDPADRDRRWVVYGATSPDGVDWEPLPEMVSTDFNSLDLFVSDEGVILMGLPDTNLTEIHGGTVYSLASADLSTWSTHGWPIKDLTNLNLVDPSLHVRWDGSLGLAYYSCDTFGMDPVDVEGPHDVRRAHWDGETFYEDEAVAYSTEWLVDPVICQLDGQEWLFATQDAQDIISASGNGDGTFTTSDIRWEGRTVPFCTSGTDAMELYGQGLGEQASPYHARVDGSTLTVEGNVYEDDLWGAGSCSSPVVGRFHDEYVLFCAVRLLH